MTHRRRWAALSAPLIAVLLLLHPQRAYADDFDNLPLSAEEAFPLFPAEEAEVLEAPAQTKTEPSVESSLGESAVTTPVATEEPQPLLMPTTADEALDLRAKALEERVNELKEKIFRTKYRLSTLAATVLGGLPSSGAKLALTHKNQLGSSYVLVSAAYTLDGAPLYTKVDETGELDEREEFLVFDQRIVPGQHQISVQYELRGHGYGVFSYLEGMRLTLRASHSFAVEPGKITRLTSHVYEKPGLTLEFADKPDVRFEMNVIRDIGGRSDDDESPILEVNTDGMP